MSVDGYLRVSVEVTRVVRVRVKADEPLVGRPADPPAVPFEGRFVRSSLSTIDQLASPPQSNILRLVIDNLDS
jgi:hypothetical protein